VVLVTHNPDDIDVSDRRLDLDAGTSSVAGAGADGAGGVAGFTDDDGAPATGTGPVLARGGAGS
jgi:hypothetical protein